LPQVFASVNETFVSIAIEGLMAMAGGGDFVDLESLWRVIANCEVDILPGARDVKRDARADTQDWWHLFGYKVVLTATEAKLRRVKHYLCYFLAGASFAIYFIFLLQELLKWVGKESVDDRHAPTDNDDQASEVPKMEMAGVINEAPVGESAAVLAGGTEATTTTKEGVPRQPNDIECMVVSEEDESRLTEAAADADALKV
jgi:hypothetical protein